MKKMLRNIFVVFSFFCVLSFFCESEVTAKTSSSDVFEIIVGNEKLLFNYNLVSSQVILSENSEIGNLESGAISMKNGNSYIVSDGKILDDNGLEVGVISENIITMNNSEVYTLSSSLVKEKIVIPVTLKGLENEGKSYRWEHNFCYKIVGMDEICELDKTGKDQGDGSQDILSNQTYQFSFWDGHMPYYSEELVFEYVRFSNKFICLEENSNEVITLDEIEFSDVNSEIDYSYAFSLKLDAYKKDDKEYVGYDKQGLFVNNGNSQLSINNLPTYKIVNEICVSETECDVKEYNMVTAGFYRYALTPYIGNINLPYNSEKYKDGGYENISFKTTLECLNNCDNNRRVKDKIVLLDKTFDYYINVPFVDESNTKVDSYSELMYIKNSEVKITLKDDFSGLNEESLKYYIVEPDSFYNSCANGTVVLSDSFVNGEIFTIGEGLNGGYCMYYSATNNIGNTFNSKYHIFYFDNKGPSIQTDNSGYIDDYYNEVNIKIYLSDYSTINEVYYLWSDELVFEEDYLSIKTKGKLYDNSGFVTSLNNIIDDGTYYLYLLAFDELENYKFHYVGVYKIDVTSLKIEDVVVNTNMSEYRSDEFISVYVSEMSDEEIFKCGLFNDSNLVNINSLNLSCKNGVNVVIPSNLEGEYSLWVYVHDRANNYSLLEIKKGLKIDTKGPEVSYSILKNDNNYHLTNEIVLNINDLNGFNEESLKYGWIVSSKSNVTINDLNNNFVNGGTIGYPKGYYGEYKLYVSANDSLGNQNFISLDKVFKIDTDIIRINLIGEESVTIIRGQEYKDEGATAYKGTVLNGGRISSINVVGEVNNKKAGTYYITYTSGEGDLLVSVTRKVVVKNDIPYVAISTVVFALGSVIITIRLFVRKKNDVSE